VGADLSILVHNFFTRFRRGIDRAMELSARRSIRPQERPPRFVAHISLVKGVPFHGLHVGWMDVLLQDISVQPTYEESASEDFTERRRFKQGLPTT